MSGLFTVGALAGAFFYVWAKPKAGRQAQIKMSWKDASTFIALVIVLGWIK
jgi:hypothetical protein